MIARPVRCAALTEQQAALWLAFVDAYGSTGTRPVVDVFLRALFGSHRG